jgi:hypothetical protein
MMNSQTRVGGENVQRLAIFRVVIVLVAMASVGCGASDAPSEPPKPSEPERKPPAMEQPPAASHVEAPTATPIARQPGKTVAEPELIDDDGQTLWESSTHGGPIKLAYLPPGCQIILALRPAEMLAHPEGERIAAALGPIGGSAMRCVEQTVGIPLRDIEELLIGWQVTRDGKWDTTLVVSGKPSELKKAIDALRPSATSQQREETSYLIANNSAYWQPMRADGRLLVIASLATLPDIIDLAGSPPPLRRDVERLLAHTDATRQVTLLFAPSFLFGDGNGIFSGETLRLRDPLFWFFGDDLSAVALSLHWADDFYLELAAVPTLDSPTKKVGNQLAQRLSKTPERLTSFLSTLKPSDYSQAIVARFPDMVRTLAAYTRHRADRDHVVLRCYLPVAAGQSLLMGAELTLAEAAGGASSATTPVAENAAPKSVGERLQKRTSLRFTKDTLEAGLKMLADDVGVEIVIRGPDLQLDGITKNQSFGIDLSDKSAEEILVQVLRLANPDKSATGPADPKQKLVYVVQPKSGTGSEAIFVTTRAAAQKRGDPLPGVFTAK